MHENKNINPLVSIIVITYNQKELLKDCIDSIINQDYEDIEIIISDDCSTDGSFKYNSEKYKDNKRIKFTKTKVNVDITGNCNNGLRYVKGKYVVFIGGDDILKFNKISTQVAFMESNTKCGVSYHAVEKIDINSNKLLGYMGNAYNGDASLLLKYGTINPAVGSMYRTSVIPKGGFDDRVKVASDWLFTFECLASSNTTINFIEGYFAFYRIGEENTSSKRFRKGNIDHLISRLIVLEKYPEYENLVPTSFRKYIFRMRRNYSYKFLNQWFELDIIWLKSKIAYILYQLFLKKRKF